MPALINCSLHFTINCEHVDPSHSHRRKRSLQEVCLTQAQILPHYCTQSLQTSFIRPPTDVYANTPFGSHTPSSQTLSNTSGFLHGGKKAKPTTAEGPCLFLLNTSLAPHFHFFPREKKTHQKTESLEPTGVFPSPGYIHPPPCSLIPPGRGQRQRGQAGQ